MALTTAVVVAGAAASAYSSKKAAKTAQRGYDAAAGEQARQYDQTREDYAPFREAGVNALGRLGRASEGDMSDFYKSPSYEFVRGEGERDIGNSFAARGGAFSGNALKALTQYNQNLASTEYGNWWNRQAGLAGVGQAATGGTAAAGASAAANRGNAMIGAGNARASGIQGVNTAIQGGISNYLYGRESGLINKKPQPARYWQDQAEVYGG
jgi:hypothetical protein